MSRFNHYRLPLLASAALVLILAVALGLRLVSLAEVPPNVTADEADNLQTIYHILEQGEPGPFGLDWKPSPAFSTYVMAGFMKVFGLTIPGMRMASVVLSTLSLAAFYLVARQSLSRPASLGATFLLGTSLWYLHFSRSGWENIHIALYALLATLSLTLALQRGHWYLYAATGLFAALGLYGYFSGRAIIAAIALYLPVALLLHWRNRWRVLLGFGIIALVCAALFAPQLKTIMDDWDHFNTRTRAVSVTEYTDDYMGDSGLPRILVHQVWRTIDGFFLLDSERFQVGLNARYLPPEQAPLDRITAVLFWMGLAVSIFRWRQTLLWWTMLLAMLVPVQVLSTGTPDAARAVGVAPFFFLFVGLALDWLLGLRLGEWLKLRAPIAGATALLLVAVAYVNVSGYVHWMGQPVAREARQPAVEVQEFELWQRLQINEARAGRWGFNVNQWHEIRESYRQ